MSRYDDLFDLLEVIDDNVEEISDRVRSLEMKFERLTHIIEELKQTFTPPL